MPAGPDLLVVVAHPDDETLSFGGLLLESEGACEVVCVTDGNHEGDGDARMRDCRRACEALGVERFDCLGFEDDPAVSLDVEAITAALRDRYAQRWPQRVFTHSPHGEYGHFNHIDVCLAVHRAFAGHDQLYVIAAHLYPELRVQLRPDSYARKLEILRLHYAAECRKCWRMMMTLADENFLRLPASEVEAVHALLMDGEPLSPGQAPHYHDLLPLIGR